MRAGKWFACCEPRPTGFLQYTYTADDGRILAGHIMTADHESFGTLRFIAEKANDTYYEGYRQGLADAASRADAYGYCWAAAEIRKL